jgi:hypothetical protein
MLTSTAVSDFRCGIRLYIRHRQQTAVDFMAKRDQRNTSEKPRHHHEGDDHRFHPAEDGSERRVHLDIIAGRWVGSAPPTAEAYAKELIQWRKLPGVIATSATDLGIGDSNACDAGLGGVTHKDLSGRTS